MALHKASVYWRAIKMANYRHAYVEFIKMPGDRSVASEINIVVNLHFLINCIVIIKVYAT
jgi:hypothetical protein